MYKKYISSLKGIACLLIAFGHFLGIIKYAEVISFRSSLLEGLNTTGLNFLVNEGFWLNFFLLVSGYLVANSKVNSIHKILEKCVGRFFRFVFPIFFACLGIFILSEIVGFHNSETTCIFLNKWFQSAYERELTIPLLLSAPFDILFLSKCWFNSPYWVLHTMFITSILIYILSYIRDNILCKKLNILIEIILIIGTSTIYKNRVAFFVIIGALLRYHEDIIAMYLKNRLICIVLLLIGIFISTISIQLGGLIVFSVCIVATSNFPAIVTFLESSVLDYLGKISFGIYSFHWPVFCSIGALSMKQFYTITGDKTAFYLSVLITYTITLGLAIVYHYTVENFSVRATKTILTKLKICMSSNVQN